MSGWGVIILMAVVCAAIALLLWAVIHGAKETGSEKANADTAKRQLDALKQSEQVKDETLGRMADASAASVSDTAAAARDRMRHRNPGTR